MTPVDKFLAVVPRFLEVSHGAREVALIGLQRDQPVHGTSHVLLRLRIVLQ